MYRYNFTVGSDSRVELSAGRKCSVQKKLVRNLLLTSAERERSLHRQVHVAGDRFDCWRPKVHLGKIFVQRISCGRPVCMVADVYACVDPDCVQLTDPAEQFRLYSSSSVIPSGFSTVGI